MIPGAVASISPAVWPASIGAGAAVLAAWIGAGNRRKLNGLRELERTLGRLDSTVERLDRTMERHLTDHLVKDSRFPQPEV